MNKTLISKKLITLFLLLFNVFAYSQFVTSGTATTNNLYSGGSVGVGYTTLPSFGTNKFMVTGNSLFTGTTTFTGNTTVSGTVQIPVILTTQFQFKVTT